MSKILIGECSEGRLYHLWDADAASEAEFEYIVTKALMCLYPDYRCILFGGSFRLDDQIARPDLALIAKDYSHWFVVEVELASHSLNGHVLPQIRAFQYGEPQPDCISILARETGLMTSQVQTFLRVVPRSVAVIANKRNRDWETAFASLQVQMLTVSAYKSTAGIEAIELDGHLSVLREHLGFGQFSATDRSMRFPNTVKLPIGEIMIDDATGVGALWTVVRSEQYTWVTRNFGVPDFPNGSHIQLIRTYGGRILMRQSLIA